MRDALDKVAKEIAAMSDEEFKVAMKECEDSDLFRIFQTLDLSPMTTSATDRGDE
jgi:hypothetical protein